MLWIDYELENYLPPLSKSIESKGKLYASDELLALDAIRKVPSRSCFTGQLCSINSALSDNLLAKWLQGRYRLETHIYSIGQSTDTLKGILFQTIMKIVYKIKKPRRCYESPLWIFPFRASIQIICSQWTIFIATRS